MSFRFAAVAACVALSAGAGHSAQIYADTVIDYFHSGTETYDAGFGYGGPSSTRTVSLSNATDQNTGTFVSLPTGSFITLGFSTGYVFDGTGDDLFVDEIGAGNENADLFVSTDFGATFTFLTKVFGARINGIDFSDFGYTGNVNAVKLVGLDNGGSFPGFDVTAVYGFDGSTVTAPQGPSAVPLPAGLSLLLTGLAGFGALRRFG